MSTEQVDKVYFIHDNGAQPFKVVIKYIDTSSELIPKDIYMYKHIDDEEYEKDHFIHIENPIDIFIGKSADPDKYEEFGSKNYDTYFDGNSILIQLANKEYMFVGLCIFTFSSYYPIIQYHSPVGPNDVPYPYAIDIDGNYYLLVENVVVHFGEPIDDPYNKYYNEYYITKGSHEAPLKYPNFENIVEYYGKRNNNFYKHLLYYHPSPASHYDWIEDHDETMYVVRTKSDNVKEYLSKKEYVCLMKKFGKLMGYRKLKNKKMIQNRHF